MRTSIGKTFDFEASHQLPNDPKYGKCRNLHGHRYELTVEIEGNITKDGWIIDFAELKSIVHKCVINKCDHKHMNTFWEIPTAENMARTFFDEISQELESRFSERRGDIRLKKIVLHETARSYAIVEGK